MTETGKITKDDLMNILIDHMIPNDIRIKRHYGYYSFKDMIADALHYDPTAKDVYFKFCRKAGLLPKLRKMQEDFIYKENVNRDLQKKPKIKFEPKDDYSDMLQHSEDLCF